MYLLRENAMITFFKIQYLFSDALEANAYAIWNRKMVQQRKGLWIY